MPTFIITHPQAVCHEHGPYTVTSYVGPEGNWWHVVVYRHIWHTSGGRNSIMLHLTTTTGNEPTNALLTNLVEHASTLVQAAIERQT